eukprot:11328865-Heterocapsa_arctica.AAC.1
MKSPKRVVNTCKTNTYKQPTHRMGWKSKAIVQRNNCVRKDPGPNRDSQADKRSGKVPSISI